MKHQRRFVFAGGGSGGHLYPGIAVAEELLRRDSECEVCFAGSERGIERVVLAGMPFSHRALPITSTASLTRRPFRFAGSLVESVRASLGMLDDLQPEHVIGLGGFASVPMGLAALRRGIPLTLLEQNVVPGRATSLLARFANRVCVSFNETASYLPASVAVEVTGNPLRAEVRDLAAKPSGSGSPTRGTLLVLGGSQGARGVNRMAVFALTELRNALRGWRVMHQSGERDCDEVRRAYVAAGVEAVVSSFFNDLPRLYRDAELVITRAGGTTLAELAAFGAPAIVIPYPGSVRDHQQRNAEHYGRSGGAEIVAEGPEAEKRMLLSLGGLLNDTKRRAAMGAAMRRNTKIDAASHVADLIVGKKLPLKRVA